MLIKHAMNKTLLLLAGLIMSLTSYAQEINPETISSAGAKMEQANGSITFTVGELIVQSFVDVNGNVLGNGYTSGAASSTQVLTVTEVPDDYMHVSIFPNPTTDLVQIKIENSKIDVFSIRICDAQGKIIQDEKYQSVNATIGINTSTWQNGNYQVSLISENKTIGTYSIIKQ